MRSSLIDKKINLFYAELYGRYGSQGWWPIADISSGRGVYHCKAPRDERDAFEIAIGAILTQNVSWRNAEKAVINLKSRGLLEPEKLMNADNEDVALLIRPSGYYNQKAVKIRGFLRWFRDYSFSFNKLKNKRLEILRNELLSVKGIGPETADSILLYALNRKIFVVDAYTVRILGRSGVVTGKADYHGVQSYFHDHFRGGTSGYREYHALIVEHCKMYCKKNPFCGDCFLVDLCNK